MGQYLMRDSRQRNNKIDDSEQNNDTVIGRFNAENKSRPILELQ